MKLKLWCSLLLGLCFSNAIATPAESQISPDGTTDTTVNSTDNTITIDRGDRSGDSKSRALGRFASVPHVAREIIKAKGWIVNDRGMVELVASTTDIYRNLPKPQVQCHQPGIN